MTAVPSRSALVRPLDVHLVPDAGLETAIEATAEERAAVAREINIPAIGALTAAFEISKRPADCFKVEGMVQARITQICVVSLDPFDSEVEARIDATFAPAVSKGPSVVTGASRRRSRNIEPQESVPAPKVDEEGGPLDPIIDGRIDLGAVALEFLTLSLDFYPRKPGALFSDVVTDDERQSRSAFAALERLKDRS